MLPRIIVLALVAASFVHAQPEPPKLTKELAELQGVWRHVGFDVDGKEAFVPEFRQIRWVIKNDKVYYGGEVLGSVTLDASANPRCFDLAMVQSERTYEGIYKLDKDRLVICFGVKNYVVKERPARFSNKEIDKYRTFLFEREKPGNELAGAAGYIGVQLSRNENTDEIQVVETLKGSPAAKAGFMRRDVILKVGADAAGDLQETVDLFRALKPGSSATVRIRRGDKEQDVTVKVGVAPFLYLQSGASPQRPRGTENQHPASQAPEHGTQGKTLAPNTLLIDQCLTCQLVFCSKIATLC